jgi:hypothetical protein
MLIRKIEKEESNQDGHCDSHERINSWMRYRFLNTSSGSRNFQKGPLLKSKGTTVLSGGWKGASTVRQGHRAIGTIWQHYLLETVGALARPSAGQSGTASAYHPLAGAALFDTRDGRLGHLRFRHRNTVFLRNPQRLWKTLIWRSRRRDFITHIFTGHRGRREVTPFDSRMGASRRAWGNSYLWISHLLLGRFRHQRQPRHRG